MLTPAHKFIAVGIAALFCLVLIVMFGDRPDGEELFKRERCNTCHSFKGAGGSAGPELTAVKDRRTDAWIRRQIQDPRSHNPATIMPSFNHLSRGEISALITYLKS